MELFVFFISLTALAGAANVWGANSTDSRDWQDPRDPFGYPGHHV